MDGSVKLLYINLIGRTKKPKDIFDDWVKFKNVAANNNIKLPVSYPEYVKWIIKFQPEEHT